MITKYFNNKIIIPHFKKLIKPILFGLLVTIIANISMTILTKILGGEVETHEAFTKMTPLQIFVFVCIYASIAEEILFRGFLMNILKPLKLKGIKIFKRNISIPVIISAVAFGLAHLIVITTGAGGLLLLRIVVFTTILGLIAGYYQEKYENSPNIFSLLGYETGLLITKSLNPKGKIPLKVSESVKFKKIQTPRGELTFNNFNESQITQFKLREFIFINTNYQNKVIETIDASISESLNEKFKEFPLSGWKNPYICT